MNYSEQEQITRKIQQLRNDGDDVFADIVQGLVDYRATVAEALKGLRTEIETERDEWNALFGTDGQTTKVNEANAMIAKLDATIAALGLAAWQAIQSR